MQLPKPDVLKLALCWACTLTASTLLTSCGPLAARSVGVGRAAAPMTIAAFLAGAALISLPSGALFRRFGRSRGFSLGCFFGFVGGVGGFIALEGGRETAGPELFAACFFVGVSQGLGQFYRFAASEMCGDNVDERASAVTLVLAGGLISAFAGPEASVHTRRIVINFPGFFSWRGAEFSGCFALVALTNVVEAVVNSTVRFKEAASMASSSSDDAPSIEEQLSRPLAPPPPPEESSPLTTATPGKPRRRAWEILSGLECACAVSTAALAHTAMVMLMSPVTIAMQASDISYASTSLTLELHFASMYVGGLVGTGALIRRLGPHRASVVGLAFFAGSAAVLAGGQGLSEYLVGMMLCGVAWNICFSSATVMLTTTYTAAEAQNVQGANDFVIFGVAGAGSVASGYIYSAFGWEHLVYAVTALMLAFGCGVVFMALKLHASSSSKAAATTTPGTFS